MVISELHLAIIVVMFLFFVITSGICITVYLIVNRKDFKDKTSFWEMFLIGEMLLEPDRYIKPDKIHKFRKLRKIFIYLIIAYIAIFSLILFLISIKK